MRPPLMALDLCLLYPCLFLPASSSKRRRATERCPAWRADPAQPAETLSPKQLRGDCCTAYNALWTSYPPVTKKRMHDQPDSRRKRLQRRQPCRIQRPSKRRCQCSRRTTVTARTAPHRRTSDWARPSQYTIVAALRPRSGRRSRTPIPLPIRVCR